MQLGDERWYQSLVAGRGTGIGEGIAVSGTGEHLKGLRVVVARPVSGPGGLAGSLLTFDGLGTGKRAHVVCSG